jgi:penicillin-binding protein 2
VSSDLTKNNLLRRRAFILGGAKAIFTVLVCGKLYYLQILNKSKYGKLSDLNRIKVKILYPERGAILDLYDKRIASNISDYQLSIFQEKKNLINGYITKLKNIINFSERDLESVKENLINRDLSDFIIVKKNLTWNELEAFELISNKFPFLIINEEKVRSYKNNLIFSHVLGYVGYRKDLKNKKLNNLKFGISGIEKLFDKRLLGKDGWIKLETNSRGRIKKELNKKFSIPGENIKTNLISDVQEYAYSLFKDISGAVVMVDCSNGGVNCLLSTPSFDNSEFSNGVSYEKWKSLVNDDTKPLLNRCIAGLYAPGSTYKLITSLYMIEKKGFNPNTNYFCSGNVEFGNRKFHCWKEGGHGNLNLRGAIKESCDCYFYNLAKKIKIDELAEFSKKFSLGLPTRVDIPNELSGIMPNRKWKKLNKGESWQRGETLNTVIGQGFMLATPLQISLMTAIIASGKLIRPKIQNIKQEYFDDLDVSESSLKFIREAMYSVVNEYKGTAFSSRLASKYKLVGKTGTSQVRKITMSERESGVLKNEEIAYKLRDHSIFTGFAPYKNPKYAITVVAEHMGSGSKIAAPIAKKITEFSLKKFLKT